jgi:hypothetical protein
MLFSTNIIKPIAVITILIIILFFIIYVPSQQLQGQLQTQHSVDTIIIIIIIIIIIQFNSLLFMCRVNSYTANYRHSTAQIQQQ